jgi:putative ABC transport system permease protein
MIRPLESFAQKMKVSLARSSLIHEWRRYLAAVLAVSFAGLLLVVQMALLLGLFGSVSLAIEQSSAVLWIGYRNTQSVDLGRDLPPGSDLQAWQHPAVATVERMHLGFGDWHRDDGVVVSATINAIDTHPGALAFSKLLTPEQRKLLDEPDAVIIDRADREKLGAVLGGMAEINGKRARVVGLVDGIRAIGGVNVLASFNTARSIDPGFVTGDETTYYLVGLTPGADARTVAHELNDRHPYKRYSVWRARDFSIQSQLYWLFESGAGTGAGVATLLGLIVGIVITSQTLAASILASVKEFAALRALGVSQSSLRRIVFEQAFWIGLIGLLITGILTAGAAWLGSYVAIAMKFPWWLLGSSAITILAIALGSGWYSLSALYRADPATLLR